MSHHIEFYFDCSSPWTYLAFEYIQKRTEHLDVEITWKPILVGGIFNTVNPSVYQSRNQPVPAKDAYAKKDLQDWARYVGIEIGMPSVFPVNSVKAMRGAYVAIEAGLLVPYARLVFKHYWTALVDISKDDELAVIVEKIGLDRKRFFEQISNQNYKDMLRHSTDELIERGGFGSPTLFLDGDMYFGNDRVDLMCSKMS